MSSPNKKWNEEAISDIRSALFDRGHRTVLIQGGPGSGKTWLTARLALEAAERLPAEQSALVLTFSVSAAEQLALQVRDARTESSARTSQVAVLNYHSLYRRLLDGYVRYCGVPRRWRTWLPHEVDAALCQINDETKASYARGKKDRAKQWEAANATSIVTGLMDGQRVRACSFDTLQAAADTLGRHHRDGLLHYDSWPYFAHLTLTGSSKVRRHMGARYPFIFVDEFQDTNGVEWEFIKALAHDSTLVCMCDPDQAVYLWRGADPEVRLSRLKSEREPEVLDGFRLPEVPRTEASPGLKAVADAIRQACSTAGPASGLDALGACIQVRSIEEARGEHPGSADGEWPVSYVSGMKGEIRDALGVGKRVGLLCPTWALLAAVSQALRQGYGGVALRHTIVGLEEEVGVFLAALAYLMEGVLGLRSVDEARHLAGDALEQMRRVTVKDAHGPWFGSTAQPLKRGNGQRQAKVAKTIGEALSCGLAPFEAMRAVSDAAVGIRKAMNSRRGVSIWTSDSFLDEPLARWTGDLEGFVTRNPGGTLEDVSAAAWRAVESAVARERRRRTRSWVTLATMHAAKGREFDYTFVCGASLDTRHLKPSADGTACEAIRNLLLVGCSRSREKLLILHKAAEPCCILARLQGEPCPLAAGDHRGCPAQLSLAIQLEESSGPDFE